MLRFRTYLEREFGISGEEWDTISGYFHKMDFPRNDFFIREHKVCRKTGFILEGVMRYFDPDETGAEPTCFFTFEEHYIVDPYTYEQQRPAVMNLKSVTDCALAVISYEDDRQLSAMLPRWKEIKTNMVLKASLEFADQKALLNLSAAGRYSYFTEKYPHLALRVPLQYIASYLGIAQPSLSRLRKEIATKSK